jgi:hypothetical protein
VRLGRHVAEALGVHELELDGSTRPGASPEALADRRRIADAVLFLANQDARSATHELQLTPLAENWTP